MTASLQVDRRDFVTGLSMLGLSSVVSPARAQVSASDITIVGTLPPLPTDLVGKDAEKAAPFIETDWVGTAPPSTAEIDRAYELLFNAPFKTLPIDVAQYFLAVGAGAYGEQYRPFVREWPVRANPLIYHFFSSTKTKPEGDATAWCAAFMNWCLLRAHASNADEIGSAPGSFSRSGKAFSPTHLKNYSTNHASSGSFRCWDAVDQPKRGDIVVFRNIGTDDMTAKCLGTGHVAFFLQIPKPGVVQVLGGNQALSGSGGAVTVANMSTGNGSRFLKYVSPKAEPK